MEYTTKDRKQARCGLSQNKDIKWSKTKISNEVNTTNLRCILLLETRSGLVPMQIISGLVHKHLPPGEEKGHEPWNKQDSFS